jgi:tetratricopeptide (TPR) repeat protein
MPRFINGSIPAYRTGDEGAGYHDPRRPDSPEDNLRLVISAYRTYEQVMKELYRQYDPDLFGVYFEFTDSIGHLFMKYMKPAMAGVSPDEADRYGQAIAGAYAEADRILGEALELIDDSTVLLIVSDHGFKSGDFRPLSDSRMGFGQAVEWHRIRGSIAMIGGPVKGGYEIRDAGVMDIAPTLLYLLGLPVDEKMTGRVLSDALDQAWVERHPAAYTSEYDDLAGGQALAAAPSSADQALKDKLISLGYVAGGSSALQNLATYYHKNGRFEEALEVWQQLVELEPDNSAARISLGNAYYKTGKDDMAIRVLEDVIQSDPGAMKALHSLATIHIERGRAREALEVAERAVRADPEDGWSYYDRGMALELMGRSAEAGDAYRRAVELAPDLAEAHANLAQIYAASGRPEQAMDHAGRAVELAGEQPQMLYVLGVALGASGEEQQALETYYRVIEADSLFVLGYLGACNVLLGRGETDSVLALSSRAVRIPSPYRTYMHSIKAAAHVRRGEAAAAIEEYTRALGADPRNVGARVNLASLYAQAGRRTEAIEQARKALEIDPANQHARSLLNQLQ